MCGFCGFIVDHNRNIDLSCVLTEMIDKLAHRGPDSHGHYYADKTGSIVGFGHRRLSIIDLSVNAQQPMGNEDNSVIVVFNGEIYNYEQLTVDLKKRGHKFRSNSDTEVIVHLYEEMNDECVNKLEGMFAFALLDKEKSKILLARDRMGIKPLFYTFKNNQLYFASELKALLCLNELSRELSTKALDYFITYGYIPGEETIFKDIKKLQPASYLTFERERGSVTTKKYWKIEYLPKVGGNEDDLSEKLIELLQQAIKRHLISDVPVGAFLSGGMDSSVVVAMMNQVRGKGINTFSLGYSDSGNDELYYAALVSDHFQTCHQEFKVKPDMSQIIPELMWYLDEPFFDNSIIPTYYISKLARSKVKVVLSGDGGDEIFGGYEWARRQQYQNALGIVSPLIKNMIGKSGWSALGLHDEYGKTWVSKAKRFLYDLNNNIEDGFNRRTCVSNTFRQMLYTEDLKNELNGFNASDYQYNLFYDAQVKDEREKMLYVDTMSFLPDDCLFKVDRMSMAHGLEVRVPFLDRDLVEFSARIPFEYKIKGFTSKYILKKTFAPFLPSDILRQRKQGFTIPISDWLRSDLRELARSILMSKTFKKRGLFNQKSVEWMLEKHNQKKQEFGHRIWSLVVFETWARLFLDEKLDRKPEMSLADIAGNYS
jgi:asparagine synthase (glutamine-hydrolysing)